MKMSKIFSHKVTFQIISVVLLIFLANIYMQNLNLNKYVHERVDMDLSRAMEELNDINEDIFGLYMGKNLDSEFSIETQYIQNLDRFDREIEKIFSMPRGAFRWYDIYRVDFIIDDIKKRGYLTKEDEEYLKSIHDYNKRLILAYHEALRKSNIDPNSFRRDYRKIKKIYIEFITEANKIAMEEEYKRIREYHL